MIGLMLLRTIQDYPEDYFMQAKSSPPPFESEYLDFCAPDLETIDLSPGESASAIALAQLHPNCSWQRYLNSLALVGCRCWLQERVPALTVEWQDCSLSYFGDDRNDQLPIVTGICLGEFQICLLVVGAILEPTVGLPADLLRGPDLHRQIYLLVEVREEWQQVTVQRFLRADQLVAQQQQTPLALDAEGTYQLPLDWFESEFDQLLIGLQYLQPRELPLLQKPSLGDPWLQPSLNTNLWLQGELDSVAQQLNWQLLPAFVPALRSPVRSPFAELQVILQDLQQQSGLTLPALARSAYQDAQIAESYIRLYALTWPLLSELRVPEWTLLLILGAQPGTRLPPGIKLQVSDQHQILVERELEGDPSNTYLYARVSGTWQEVFLVAITLGNGAMLTLPPFAFRAG